MGTVVAVSARRRAGVTLIEMLLVVAIIALLMTIALPALGSSRNSSRLMLSSSNLRQQVLAANAYRSDSKGLLPQPIAAWGEGTLTLDGRTRGFANLANAAFSQTGRNASARFAASNPSLDIPAGARSLTAYIFADMPLNRDVVSEPDRQIDLPAFRSPADRGSPFRDAASPEQGQQPTVDPTTSMFDHVGTSYMNNQWWYRALALRSSPFFGNTVGPLLPGESTSSSAGESYLRLLARLSGTIARRRMDTPGFQDSRFVFMTDKTAFQFQWNTPGAFPAPEMPPYQNWTSEFGDLNKSVMGFLDGSVRYQSLWTPRGVYPAGFVASQPSSSDTVALVRSIYAPDYTFLLP
jgi:prepilin-type N-terminal cleavage/methylation domain-containing protein